jgi:hypothetical protein
MDFTTAYTVSHLTHWGFVLIGAVLVFFAIRFFKSHRPKSIGRRAPKATRGATPDRAEPDALDDWHADYEPTAQDIAWLGTWLDNPFNP